MTPFGKKVTIDNAWQEYPRPQLVRNDWINLNGLWEYAIRPVEEKKCKLHKKSSNFWNSLHYLLAL